MGGYADLAIVKEEHGFGLTLAIALALMLVTEGVGRHHGKPTPSPTPSPSPTVTPTPTPTPPPPTPTPPPPTPTPTPIISVTLAWDPVADSSVQGYHLWKGTAPGAENMLVALVPAGSATSAIVPVLSGTTYFVVTAYNPAGDGLPSNEVSYTTP